MAYPATAHTAPSAPTPAASFQARAHWLLSGTRYSPLGGISFSPLASGGFSSSAMALLSLGQLQGAHVAHDRPAIVDRYARAVGGHGANAVADGCEQLTIGHLPKAVLVKAGRWRCPTGAHDNRAASGAGAV